ncbi:MAG: dihydroneopterin aldolase family protein [Nitrososphaerota archaeon]
MRRVNDPGRKYFYRGLSDSERAAFEAGIALATAYHYLLGLPLPRRRASIHRLLDELGRGLASQPFREKVELRVKGLRIGKQVYRYGRIDPRSLEVSVVVRYGGSRVWGRMSWVEELDYPLMRIEKVVHTDGLPSRRRS